MPAKLPDTQAVHVLVDKELLRRIKAWQHAHEIDTRTEAMRELWELGLESDGKPAKRAGSKPGKKTS